MFDTEKMKNTKTYTITKTFVDGLPKPAKVKEGRTEQKRYYDKKLTGFGVRITSGGTIAFFVEKLVNGNLQRSTLGHYKILTVEEARNQARIELGRMTSGIDLIAEKRAKKLKGVTLGKAFEDYIEAKNENLKATTVLDYKRVLNQVVLDWLNKPLTKITKDMIAKRHTKHGESNSKARANLAMRLLRAIFNFAIEEYQTADGKNIITGNPVKTLSHGKRWHRINRRQSVIKQYQLSDLYKAIMQLSECYPYDQATMWQDYFLLILFTGMRRSEAASLEWNDIDLKSKTFTLHDTKNRESHSLPMTDFIYGLFNRRKEFMSNKFVFAADSESGHIVEPRKAMLKIIELSGVKFTLHDCRRTFLTIAESLDIPAYAVKRLANHKMGNDVTSGYIIADVERLRKPMQQITDYLLKNVGIQESARIIKLNNMQGNILYEERA